MRDQGFFNATISKMETVEIGCIMDEGKFSDVHNIYDHMARACVCGCVRFNLLRSSSIECADCGADQQYITWRDNMNPNYQPEEKTEFSAEDIEKGEAIILSAINKTQQCFLLDIVKEANKELPIEALLEASRSLQKGKKIRLREDSYEHAMEYMLTK